MDAQNKTSGGGDRTEVRDSVSTSRLCYPPPATVKAAVLADLLEGRKITHRDCWLEHGSSRLAHHAYVLRGLGWPIDCNDVAVPTRDGRRAEIGVYDLPRETIAEAGDQGQRFIGVVRAKRQTMRSAA